MISLIRNKFESTVNQMRPLSPVIRIKGNQRRPLTVFDHTFDVRKGVFSCSGDGPRKSGFLTVVPAKREIFLRRL